MSMLDAPLERISILEGFIVELASEGVPMACLARGFRIPSGEIRDLLSAAHKDGRIIELPSSDWKVERSEREKIGSSRYRTVDSLIPVTIQTFKLTRSQAIMLSLLLVREIVSKDDLHASYERHRSPTEKGGKPRSEPTDPKIIDVLVCMLRKKLKPFGVEIETMWGTGYSLRPAMRELTFTLLDGFLSGQDVLKVEDAPAVTV